MSEFFDREHHKGGPQVPVSVAEQEFDKIKSRITDAVGPSTSWGDLQRRLGEKNLELAPKGGGLVFRQADTKIELCKASDIGFAYSRLIKRYGAGWPGHPHEWIADRILSKKTETS